VVPGQRVTDHLKDHEVDFLAAARRDLDLRRVSGQQRWHHVFVLSG
jgi:hypothetical protein